MEVWWAGEERKKEREKGAEKDKKRSVWVGTNTRAITKEKDIYKIPSKYLRTKEGIKQMGLVGWGGVGEQKV